MILTTKHAKRFEYLHECLDSKVLDESYRAAMFILAYDERLSNRAAPHLSYEGIDFNSMLADDTMDMTDRIMIETAYSLFRWKIKSGPTPYSISQLGYPLIDVAISAIYIASGLYRLRVKEDEHGNPMLVLDKSKYDFAVEYAERMEECMQRFMEKYNIQEIDT